MKKCNCEEACSCGDTSGPRRKIEELEDKIKYQKRILAGNSHYYTESSITIKNQEEIIKTLKNEIEILKYSNKCSKEKESKLRECVNHYAENGYSKAIKCLKELE